MGGSVTLFDLKSSVVFLRPRRVGFLLNNPTIMSLRWHSKRTLQELCDSKAGAELDMILLQYTLLLYKARDSYTGKILALKKVRFDNFEAKSIRFMAREILILRCLDHPNVVKLHGLVTSRMSCSLYLVFAYMDHDLAGLTVSPGIKFTESQV
ncbi:hypothetical protein Dimus_033518 [Dionaea muscipula]